MVKILREADTAPVIEMAKKHGISDQTIYLWRKKFGQLEPADVKRLRQLEQENAKLKKLVAERDLEIEVMKEIAAKNGRRARASSPGRLRMRTRPIDPTSVRADVSGPIDIAVRVASGETRCAGGDRSSGASMIALPPNARVWLAAGMRARAPAASGVRLPLPRCGLQPARKRTGSWAR